MFTIICCTLSLPDFSVQMKAKRFLQCLSPITERYCKDKKYLANYVQCGLYFYIFYRNIWIWTLPPVEVTCNWEVQSAIAVVSRPQKANNNIIRFIITFLFRGLYFQLSAKVGISNEKWKKRRDHFFHFTKINECVLFLADLRLIIFR